MRNPGFAMKPWMMALTGAAALALAGCQTVPGTKNGTQGAAAAEPSAQTQSVGAPHAITENSRALDVRVFLADTRSRPDWMPVTLKPSGVLYVQPTPVISRSDLMGIQSATDQKGDGILVLILNDAGLQKMRTATAANPGLRLALVVGHTMLAAPGYAAPVNQQKLAFGVGSAHNAELAARSVAGVDAASPAGGF